MFVHEEYTLKCRFIPDSKRFRYTLLVIPSSNLQVNSLTSVESLIRVRLLVLDVMKVNKILLYTINKKKSFSQGINV